MMTRLDLWSRVLTAGELAALQEECAPYHGDVIAWADMYRGLRGQIQIAELELCRSCPEPDAPTHGDVRLEGRRERDDVTMQDFLLDFSLFIFGLFTCF